jgi:hypothetical protein
MRLSLRICLLAVIPMRAFAHPGPVQRSPVTPSSGVSPVERVVESLQSCPAWSAARCDPEVVIAHLGRLARVSTPTLRAGIERFVARCKVHKSYDIANMSKPFVLNRLLFLVPDKEMPDVRRFGGWERSPNDTSGDPLWPVRLKDGLEPRLKGKYSGYSGPSYLAVEEFDYFLREYGRRPVMKGLPNQKHGANRSQPLRPAANPTPATTGSRRSP